MYAVVRPEITFKKDENIAVYEKEKYLTDISEEIYSLLMLFNGKMSDDDIKRLLAEVYVLDKRYAESIFETIRERFAYVLVFSEESNYEREFERLSDTCQYVDYRKIRYIVPKMLVISLTRNCFMKCRYCYADAKYSEKAEEKYTLDLNLIEKVVKEAALLQIKHIDLTGGDPFIREDIFEILDLLKKYNMTTALSTKKLLTDEEIDKLAQCDHITSLQISLDTLDDSIQEVLIMQKGYATDMVCVIKKLLKKGIKVKVNSVVTRHNIAGIIKLLCFLEQIGVSEYVISPYSANMGRNSTDFHPTYEQYRELFSAVDEMHTSMKIDHPVLEYITLDNNENFYQNKNNVICNAGIDGFIIGTDGSACVCERMAQSGYSLGNIKDMSIMEIWNSPKIENYYNPSIELFKASKCYECEEREYCIKQRGICFVHSYILNGTIYSPDNFCKYNDKSKRIY